MISSNLINIIDYGVSGNLSSLINSLEKIDKKINLVNKDSDFPDSGNIILPGVGSFDSAIKELKKNGVYDKLYNLNTKKYKILGICLGMQILGKSSEESYENIKGIGLLNISTVKFKPENSINTKIPHIGWNKLYSNKLSPINGYFYFLHSFFIENFDNNTDTYFTDYNEFTFPSFLKKGEIYCCQFHPEKSGLDGLNFLETIFSK